MDQRTHELITTPFKQYSSQNKSQSAELEGHFGKLHNHTE